MCLFVFFAALYVELHCLKPRHVISIPVVKTRENNSKVTPSLLHKALKQLCLVIHVCSQSRSIALGKCLNLLGGVVVVFLVELRVKVGFLEGIFDQALVVACCFFKQLDQLGVFGIAA